MENIKALSDASLVLGLVETLSSERLAVVKFLRFLNEYDVRRNYEVDGYSSLFKYLVEGLHLSEPAAAKRITAMRLIRQWPSISERISAGKIHLTGLYTVSKYLTEDNYDQVLDTCNLRSKTWIEEYLARDFQAKGSVGTKRDVVRPIIAAQVGTASTPTEQKIPYNSAPSGLVGRESAPAPRGTSIARNEKKASTTPTQVTPAPSSPPQKSVRISTDLEAGAFDDLKRARELLGARDFGVVIGKALRSYLKKIDPRLRTTRPKKSPPKAKREDATNPKASLKRSRYVPQSEKTKVHQRDQGRCAYVSPDGKRCDETAALQLEHRIPFALGGTNTVENLEQHCPAHNRMKARQVFGAAFIMEKVRLRNASREYVVRTSPE